MFWSSYRLSVRLLLKVGDFDPSSSHQAWFCAVSQRIGISTKQQIDLHRFSSNETTPLPTSYFLQLPRPKFKILLYYLIVELLDSEIILNINYPLAKITGMK